MRPLILIGGGGHCKSVIDVAESAGYNILGILDVEDKVGITVLGHSIVGTDADIPKYVDRADFVITVGQIKNNNARKRIARLVSKAGGHFAKIIASDAYVSKYAEVGEGTIIMHKAFINAGVRVGFNCIINTMANLEHDVQVGDFCHISTGTMVNGETKIGDNCFVGSGSTLFNCISIKSGAIIPAGSVVKKSVE